MATATMNTTSGIVYVRSIGGTLSVASVTSSGNFTIGGNIELTSGGSFYWTGRALLTSPADGILRLTNNAGTDFSRLQFGGTTSSFPALKRSGATLEAKLADDSAYTSILVNGVGLSGQATVPGAVLFGEISDPGAPAANRGTLYVRDTGGKSQLCIVFPTGAVQVIATEP